MRFTAASMCGSKNGSLNDFSRGCKNAWTSSALANPFRASSRAIHSQPQISLHEIGAPFRSSGGIRIQLARTDYIIRGLLADKLTKVFLQRARWLHRLVRPMCRLERSAELSKQPSAS